MNISRPETKSASGLNPSKGVGASGAGSASTLAAGQGAASDQVQLSNLSGYLSSTLSGSPARLAKLSELGTAVSSGQYYVDSYAVSGSIIQHILEFGGASTRGLST